MLNNSTVNLENSHHNGGVCVSLRQCSHRSECSNVL